MPKRSKAADSAAAYSGTRAEPTNDELKSGTWQQPPAPAKGITVTVPEGVFAQLKQAREMYPELSEAEVKAFDTIMDFKAEASDYAKNGDMSPETAECLAVAQASKVFGSIGVHVMPPHLQGVIVSAIIGTIHTTGGDRYFWIGQPVDSDGEAVASVVKQAQKLAGRKNRKDWWSDYENVAITIMWVVAAVGAITPIVLALVFWNALFLLFWVAGVGLLALVAMFLDM